MQATDSPKITSHNCIKGQTGPEHNGMQATDSPKISSHNWRNVMPVLKIQLRRWYLLSSVFTYYTRESMVCPVV